MEDNQNTEKLLSRNLKTFGVRCNQETHDKFDEIAVYFRKQDLEYTRPKVFELVVEQYHNQIFIPLKTGTKTEPVINNNQQPENSDLLNQIEALKAENQSLKQKLQDAEKISNENGKTATDLQLKMEHADIVIESMKEAIKELEQSKNIPENYISIEAWIFEVLKLVCLRIEKEEGKKFEPAQLLEKYIIEYNVKGNRYFHGFYIKKSDIEAIKKQLGI